MARQGKSTTKKPAATSKPATAAQQPYDAAARRRIQQKKRQQVVRRMRRLEYVLPDLAGRSWLPRLSWPAAPRQWLRSRWLWGAFLILLVAGALAAWVYADDRWYVYTEDVHFNGLSYIDREELWRLSDMDGWNVFWIDAETVRQRLLQHPYVAAAEVHPVQLLGTVTVDIVEARPVALWVTDQGELWLLDDGVAVEPRGETPPGLLQILDGPAAATAPGAPTGVAIDPEVLQSAQALVSRLPGVAPLRYNQQIGLNFRLPDKPYWVYWGDGADVERKLENLTASEALLAEGAIDGQIIDVRYERPYVQ